MIQAQRRGDHIRAFLKDVKGGPVLGYFQAIAT